MWNIIESGGVDPQDEMMALNALCSAVPPELVPMIAKKETTKEAWDVISDHEGWGQSRQEVEGGVAALEV